ncbi:MAG: hypothetical protein FJ293_06235 [Planctomycetes bacterium]|nr:hypothetical protein [Planctomycetota bacterium]
MEPGFRLSSHQFDEALVFCFLALLVVLVPLPAILFKFVRTWAREQPQLGSAALAGAILIIVVAVLAVATVALALMGWLPPPNQWGSPLPVER